MVANVRSGVVRVNVETCDGEATGSGLIVSPHHVVTVEHVVDGAGRISLERSRNLLGEAMVVGVDADRDLALLRVKRPITGHVFTFAKRNPRLGEEVAALGYPLGLPLSVTRGTVSGLGRTIPIERLKRRALIQTDAADNHGNSGGPLLSANSGQVVGLVDLGRTEANGIAFAVSGTVAPALVDVWKRAPQPHPLAHCRHPVAPSTNPPPTDRRPVGVPAVYGGRFTSVDRLERCLASDVQVFCSAGPSNKAVRLTVGGAVSDVSPFTSRDLGGASMPEGTSFTTPAGTIRCESSSRGISCKDTVSSASFTIGDYRIVIDQGSSSDGGDSSGFYGDFASVDRLERCYLDADYVSCTAAPSGKGVSLSVGGLAVYEGLTGSSDNGGPALGLGRSVTSSSRSLRCDSSSRGITCRDTRSGNEFVIGDYTVIVRNNGVQQRH